MNENFKIKGGLLENESLTTEQLKSISELPSKEVLLSKIIGSIVAPHRGLLHVLNGVSSNLVRVINAIKEKKV